MAAAVVVAAAAAVVVVVAVIVAVAVAGGGGGGGGGISGGGGGRWPVAVVVVVVPLLLEGWRGGGAVLVWVVLVVAVVAVVQHCCRRWWQWRRRRQLWYGGPGVEGSTLLAIATIAVVAGGRVAAVRHTGSDRCDGRAPATVRARGFLHPEFSGCLQGRENFRWALLFLEILVDQNARTCIGCNPTVRHYCSGCPASSMVLVEPVHLIFSIKQMAISLKLIKLHSPSPVAGPHVLSGAHHEALNSH